MWETGEKQKLEKGINMILGTTLNGKSVCTYMVYITVKCSLSNVFYRKATLAA